MAANTNPIYTVTPFVTTAVLMTITVANTSGHGVGTMRDSPAGGATDLIILHKPNQTNDAGSYLAKLRVQAFAGAAAVTMAPAVIRIYITSAATVTAGQATTALDTCLIQEIAVAALATSNTVALPFYEIPFGFALKIGEGLLCSLSVVNTANSGWNVSVFGGYY